MADRLDIMTPRKKKDGGTYWVKIGTAWQSQRGTQLVFDALPIPDNEGRVVANLFEPRERNGGGGGLSNQRQPVGADDDLDSVPF